MLKVISNLNEKFILTPLRKVPGEKRFGLYRFLPLFFILGASLEFLMCNLKAGPGQVNFYSTLKKRQAIELIDSKEQLEKEFCTKKVE